MQRGVFVLVAVGLAVGLVAARDGATHHGWSGYDSNVTLNLTGVIKQSGYEHPHGFLRLEVPEKVWLVVLAPPSRMERRGLTAAMLAPGTKVTVLGYPNRTDAEEMRAERITVNGILPPVLGRDFSPRPDPRGPRPPGEIRPAWARGAGGRR